jgi:tetratricopeptide (TPR) repeat protein
LLGLARYDEARALLEDVLKVRYAQDDRIEKGQFELGLALTGLERYAAAEDTLRHASERARRRYGDDNEVVKRVVSALAVAIGKQGRFNEADSLFEFAQSEFVRLSDSVNYFRATTLIDRAELRVRMGEQDAAEGFLRQALAIREELFSAESPVVAEARSELAGVLIELGQKREARELLDLASPVLEKEFVESHPLRRAIARRQEAVRE